MTTLIEAAKLALEALEEWEKPMSKGALEAHRILRTAISEAEKQEPVALEAVYETIIYWDEGGGKRSRRELARRIVALYTAPPAAQPCQTCEALARTVMMDQTAHDTTPPAQPEPMRLYVEDFARKCGWGKDSGEGAFEYVQRKSYAQGLEDATPPAAQRQPLTDDRIGQIIEQCKITLVNYCSGEKQTEFARAIEAAHGIREKNT